MAKFTVELDKSDLVRLIKSVEVPRRLESTYRMKGYLLVGGDEPMWKSDSLMNLTEKVLWSIYKDMKKLLK